MFSKIITYFTGLFTTVEHDVEAIISDFTSTVEKLEDAAAAKFAEARALADKAALTQLASDAAHEASAKAASVAAKIKDLIA
ncbi:hypothetical protein [Tardiphaga sp. 367_B4_N1_1]|uniref:hypothetical protein n=1 Tax=Tardiphaga sp. 367_B4_N1_1 TaxID=3240777 RepID=UPI003F2870DE